MHSPSSSSKNIRILLVGDQSVGKSTLIMMYILNYTNSIHTKGTFAQQLCNEIYNRDKQQQQQQPTVGCNIQIQIHNVQSSNNNQQEYFVDWYDIGAKYFDNLKANEVFFSHYNGVVFMFDMYDNNSLQFYEDKISPFVSNTSSALSQHDYGQKMDSTVTIASSSSSTLLPTTVTQRRGMDTVPPILKRGSRPQQKDSTGIDTHVPILIIGNHCSQFSTSTMDTMELPLISGTTYTKGRGIFQLFSSAFSMTLFVLSKILCMSEYFQSNETSQRNLTKTRALASRLQHSLKADYMELDTPGLTVSQRRLIDNFLDKVIYSNYHD
jgi:GTPase SAR1 family protein